MPFADPDQRGGQPVVHGAEPAELIDPDHEVVVPGDQPGGGGRGTRGRLGLLGGCGRIKLLAHSPLLRSAWLAYGASPAESAVGGRMRSGGSRDRLSMVRCWAAARPQARCFFPLSAGFLA